MQPRAPTSTSIASVEAEGKCGKCKVLIEGNVQSDETDLLTAEEKAGGYFLACLARVAGNLTVIVPKESRVESHQILHEKRDHAFARD